MAAGSAAIEPWDQYISPEDAEKESPPVFVLERVCELLRILVGFCDADRTSVVVDIYARVTIRISVCLCFSLSQNRQGLC